MADLWAIEYEYKWYTPPAGLFHLFIKYGRFQDIEKIRGTRGWKSVSLNGYVLKRNTAFSTYVMVI